MSTDFPSNRQCIQVVRDDFRHPGDGTASLEQNTDAFCLRELLERVSDEIEHSIRGSDFLGYIEMPLLLVGADIFAEPEGKTLRPRYFPEKSCTDFLFVFSYLGHHPGIAGIGNARFFLDVISNPVHGERDVFDQVAFPCVVFFGEEREEQMDEVFLFQSVAACGRMIMFHLFAGLDEGFRNIQHRMLNLPNRHNIDSTLIFQKKYNIDFVCINGGNSIEFGFRTGGISMSKKIAVFFLAVCVLVGTVAAQKPVKLVIAGRDGDYGNAMQVAVDAYMAKNPNVTFEVLKLSGDDVYQKTVIDLRSGTGTYDLILIDDPKAMQYQQAGWLEDLDAMFKKTGQNLDQDFIQNVINLCRYPNGPSGKLYSLPFVGNVSLFAYREDLFAKYNLPAPKTWSDVLVAAKKISENEPNVSGVSFRGVKGNPILTAFLPIFWSFGADFFDAAGKPVVNSPEAVKALKFFLELAKYGPKSTPMNNTAQIRDGLLAGTVGIAPEVWPAWLGKINDPNESKVVGKVKIMKHPSEVKKSSPMNGIWHIAIPSSSKNKQAAFDFLTFVTSRETQKLMVLKAGLPPSRKSVFEDKEVLEKYPWYPAIMDALENSVARPRTLYWAEIENMMGGLVQEALIGAKTPEQALNEANAKLNEIIKQ